ncbi:hypothetical protein [uncultured Corynebacterium sp.]|uniref:hypothetical protein n=1 Tax=uncultured Corynebacterium sp. TaxID=159447 RepID=UPI00262F452B|nr:hypothetical protein [uncultured Corynebacterium sp.]
MNPRRPIALAVAVTVSAAMVLTGCAEEKHEGNSVQESSVSEKVSTSAEAAPEFTPKDVAPKTVEKFTEPVVDEGLGLTYKLSSVASGNFGGTTVVVTVENNNEQPFPPSALQATYRYEDYNGDNQLEEAEPLTISDPDYIVGLDVPLGVGAKANLNFPYNVSPSTAYDAEFTIGNVTFKGNVTVNNQ